jgi:glycerol-3-phosphate acyltransferase PlsY
VWEAWWRTIRQCALLQLLVWRHRANIARLMAGEESRIGAKSADGR